MINFNLLIAQSNQNKCVYNVLQLWKMIKEYTVVKYSINSLHARKSHEALSGVHTGHTFAKDDNVYGQRQPISPPVVVRVPYSSKGSSSVSLHTPWYTSHSSASQDDNQIGNILTYSQT